MLCTICDGTGWKPVEEGGVSRVVRCDCWKHTSAERLARDADIPPRYEKCDLDNFHDYNDSLSKAVGRARRTLIRILQIRRQDLRGEAALRKDDDLQAALQEF